jgi:hypothetical protein
MQNQTSYRIARATVLAGLAALMLATHGFVAVDRVRVKVVEAPATATAGLVRTSTADFRQVNELRPPFALIARINSRSAGNATFSVAVDGATVCERSVAGGGSRRLDCAVTGEWNPTIEHEVAIQGPPTAWTLDYLELATHHGNTDGAHYLIVLPALSRHYERPALGWVISTWVMLTAILLFPTPRPLPRWIRVLYRVVAGAVLLELALSLSSEWVSNYRVVLSAGTFTTCLILLFAPRLWAASRFVAQTGATYVGVGPMARRRVELVVALVLFVSGVTAWQLFHNRKQIRTTSEQLATTRNPRQALLEELQPVTLTNCTLRRFGGPNDGGYLMCENLINGAESAYSYGIAGEDNWGCDLSKRFSVPVHQYDCFDTRQPVCEGGRFVFHAECIGAETATIESRPFDTLTNQISKNGDAGKRLIVKMDVEGAEWDSLLATPDSVLNRIAQLPMELHGTDGPRFLKVVRKLKRTFHLVHIHFNNMACTPSVEPFPAAAFQVLFVNKRIGMQDASAQRPTLPNPADAPDNPAIPDCQLSDVRNSGSTFDQARPAIGFHRQSLDP